MSARDERAARGSGAAAPRGGAFDPACAACPRSAPLPERLLTQAYFSKVDGIDPSDSQLAFARTQSALARAHFTQGDVMALPFPDSSFDAAVMALVIFFVPEPARDVAEMARVVRPGGLVVASAWDFSTGGFPFHPIQSVLREMAYTPPLPPSVEAGREPALQALWTEAGLVDVETRESRVTRSFDDFDDFWNSSTSTGALRPLMSQMAPEKRLRRSRTGCAPSLRPAPMAGSATPPGLPR